ncbi:hypothetical protein Pyn_39223 [Prunus yedoensis var. nudiflora]|uniref:Uncharacterized protein n=1 Tax=Prunus yedoensis var. nudiflora TaxID=2094558 RepID=A0A314YIJ6_PRUYE|nr:hypothetical protein Pyn_39223 [Prunus yedoensis var. nudiflora]
MRRGPRVLPNLDTWRLWTMPRSTTVMGIRGVKRTVEIRGVTARSRTTRPYVGARLSERQSSPPIRCYLRMPGADTCPILSSPCTCATWRALNLRACSVGSNKSP